MRSRNLRVICTPPFWSSKIAKKSVQIMRVTTVICLRFACVRILALCTSCRRHPRSSAHKAHLYSRVRGRRHSWHSARELQR
uniref:Uncharacterized protein n=1 Tax=Rhipicephalus zambeziensis TaxID=60191 RepID=A0A224Y650_9ACAR